MIAGEDAGSKLTRAQELGVEVWDEAQTLAVLESEDPHLGTITGLSVTSASANKQEAFDFVNWVSGPEGAAIMAQTGNFPALSNDAINSIIAGLDGFPQDGTSKDALEVSNLYLEVPYAEKVSEINAILDTYHTMIMSGELTVKEGIEAMNNDVAALK